MEVGRSEAGSAGKSGDGSSGKAGVKAAGTADRRKALRWGVLALAVLVGLIAWLATRGGGEKTAPTSTEAGPRIVTEAELREASATLGQPIYWAGPMVGKELELKKLGEGRGVQVVYLPNGAKASEAPVTTLTVGSYPLSNPEKAVEGYAKRPGSEVLHGHGGAKIVVSEAAPTSAYLASPDNKVEVEVYDPSPRRAMSLALSGRVKPVP